jgi:hypothetical protein
MEVRFVNVGMSEGCKTIPKDATTKRKSNMRSWEE